MRMATGHLITVLCGLAFVGCIGFGVAIGLIGVGLELGFLNWRAAVKR